MRAIVLDVDPRQTAPVALACDLVGMPYTRVGSLPALPRASELAGPYRIVALAGGDQGSADARRCVAVLRTVACPVFVLHHDDAFARLVDAAASRPACWLPLHHGWSAVLDRLDAAQRDAYAARLRRPPAGNQAAVFAALGAGAPRAAIAADLHLRPGTLKTYLDRLLVRYEAGSIDELQAVARLALREREPVHTRYATAPSLLPARATPA